MSRPPRGMPSQPNPLPLGEGSRPFFRKEEQNAHTGILDTLGRNGRFFHPDDYLVGGARADRGASLRLYALQQGCAAQFGALPRLRRGRSELRPAALGYTAPCSLASATRRSSVAWSGASITMRACEGSCRVRPISIASIVYSPPPAIIKSSTLGKRRLSSMWP